MGRGGAAQSGVKGVRGAWVGRTGVASEETGTLCIFEKKIDSFSNILFIYLFTKLSFFNKHSTNTVAYVHETKKRLYGGWPYFD